MRSLFPYFLTCFLALASAVSAQEIPSDKPNPMALKILNATVDPTPAGGSVAVAALLENPTSHTLVITGAASPLAGQTVLQRYMKDSKGIIQLIPVEALPLPPHSETVLAPGALELQLVGLTVELQQGLELPVTLKFAEGTQRVVRMRVR